MPLLKTVLGGSWTPGDLLVGNVRIVSKEQSAER